LFCAALRDELKLEQQEAVVEEQGGPTLGWVCTALALTPAWALACSTCSTMAFHPPGWTEAATAGQRQHRQAYFFQTAPGEVVYMSTEKEQPFEAFLAVGLGGQARSAVA